MLGITTIGSVMGRIFSTEKSVEKAIDTVSAGLDKIWYTKEEQADAENEKWKARHEAQVKSSEMLITWIQSSQGHNLARRWLTVNITSVWLVQMLLGMVFAIASVWAEKPDQFLATSGILQGYASEMGTIVLIIVLFYFAAPHMGEALNILLSRFGINVGNKKGGAL